MRIEPERISKGQIGEDCSAGDGLSDCREDTNGIRDTRKVAAEQASLDTESSVLKNFDGVTFFLDHREYARQFTEAYLRATWPYFVADDGEKALFVSHHRGRRLAVRTVAQITSTEIYTHVGLEDLKEVV